ncbi:siderophore-interacting protein [Herbiconiux flava]|uniref:NADPH-dependent ferric siderophore reductase n=1 Tax=Herbiconiux flava TaxID=881268 RepID=A0A852SQE6_9MICO|nr:siderophore-interacting protein [Herbiconiux flava]NYD71061.1 NADPH-dependent ferric siderophore reductase [Herbiconiux flava]GLK18977.1 siderophore-interacting protein [Herbiconiux flava]
MTDVAPTTPVSASPTDAGRRPARPPQPQRVLQVRRTEQLTPHLVRVVAHGEAVAGIPSTPHTDRYAKMLFAPAGSLLRPPFDLAALRATRGPAELPSQRTYTVRRVDHAWNEVWIDFVVHGTTGVAGPWAAAARPGDDVVISGIGSGYAPDPAASSHLFAGDESAVPAIAAALESLPADARGLALIEVDGPADELPLVAPSGVGITWVHRGGAAAGASTALVDALAALRAPTGDTQAFVHGERGAMKSLRPLLLDTWGIPRARLSLSAYWAFGRAEDAFQAEKREPVGQIFPA